MSLGAIPGWLAANSVVDSEESILKDNEEASDSALPRPQTWLQAANCAGTMLPF